MFVDPPPPLRTFAAICSHLRGTGVRRIFNACFSSSSSFRLLPIMPPKQVCKFFQQGNCRFGNSCKFFHPSGQLLFGSQPTNLALKAFQDRNPNDLAKTIQTDLSELPYFQFKPTLTTYGYNEFTANSLIEGRDMSAEELRLQYMEAVANNSLQAYDKNLELRQKDMEYCVNEIKSKDSLAARYQQVGATRKELIKPFIPKTLEQSINDLQNNAGFGGSGFGNSGGFGSSGFGSSPFGNTGGAFGSQSTSAFGQQNTQPSAFGQQNTQNSAFGGQNTQNSAFGSQNNQSSAFGQSGFGQQPSAFGQSGFGKTDNKNSAFGSSAFGSLGLTGGAFGSQSTGGAFGSQNLGGAFGSQTSGGSGAFGSQSTGGSGAFGSQNTGGSGAFGSQNTSGGGAFGSQSTSGSGAFGSQGTTQNKPAQLNSGFGQAGFGQAGFGQSGFGQSGFGQSGFGKSGFGQSGSGQSGFGQLGFGSSNTSNTGNSGSAFGQSSTSTQSGSAFGQSGFGQTNTNSAFGAAKTPEPSGFGQSGFGGSQPSAFSGQAQSQSAFGQSAPNTTSPFGQAAAQPAQNPFAPQPAAGTQAPTQTDSGFGGFTSNQASTTSQANSTTEPYPDAYDEPAFTLGKVPEIPPPQQICH